MAKRRKLIYRSEIADVVCDKQGCDFKFEVPEEHLHEVINARCEKCGENVLTLGDYITYLKLIRHIDRINKWFGWVTIFMRKPIKTDVCRAHTHKGVRFEKVERKDE